MTPTVIHEHVRWHEDWWGKCRTCRHWQADRKNDIRGRCSHESGPLDGMHTLRTGHCVKWDTFDMEAAEVVMRMDEKEFG